MSSVSSLLFPPFQANVFLNSTLAGSLTRDENENYTFEYNRDYIKLELPPISVAFPVKEHKYLSKGFLHPFFDNLVSEGWLRIEQAKYASIDKEDKLILLARYGLDLFGAVHLEPSDGEYNNGKEGANSSYDLDADTKLIGLTKASIPGMQRKILVKKSKNSLNEYKVSTSNELSTHIAKLPNDDLEYLLELEYLTTLACRYLLPDDDLPYMELGFLRELNSKALFVERFDRYDTDKRRHFEEFTQLLGKLSDQKYDASYGDMARFILHHPKCNRDDVYKLFTRVLVFLLLGNTDAHLKNFAMFVDLGQFTLTPMYDVIAAAYYKDFQAVALKVNRSRRDYPNISDLKPKHIVQMGREEFDLSNEQMIRAFENMEKNLKPALKAIKACTIVESVALKNKLREMIKKQWHETFKGMKHQIKKSNVIYF